MPEVVSIVEGVQVVWLGRGWAGQRIGMAHVPRWGGDDKPWCIVDDLFGLRYLSRGFANAEVAEDFAFSTFWIKPGEFGWYRQHQLQAAEAIHA